MRYHLRASVPTIRTLFLHRAMSLSSKQLLSGARWDYSIIGPVQGDGLHRSTVFKAEVVPRDRTSTSNNIPKWAVLKSTPPDDQRSRELLKREWETCLRPPVASSTAFRKLYDLIGDPSTLDDETSNTTPPYLALEWLDLTLADVVPSLDRHGYALITAVVETIMSSIVSLGEVELVNTDTKPTNILVSGAGTCDPVVKVADLGLVFPSGTRYQAQSHAMRAPEFWRGLPCSGPCQVWACAAMLLCWMKPGVLGTAGNLSGEVLRNSWCIAKLKRLFPDWSALPCDHPLLEAERTAYFAVSTMFLEEGDAHPLLQDMLPLEHERDRMGLLPELKDLLRFLFVTGPDARPSAAQVLASQQLRALRKVLSAMK